MTKRFVIATDPLTTDQIKALKESLKGAAWWYWLPNFWLIKDGTETLRASSIRDAVRAVSPNIRCLVLEVDKVTWAAMSRKNAKGRNMTDWIKETWDVD